MTLHELHGDYSQTYSVTHTLHMILHTGLHDLLHVDYMDNYIHVTLITWIISCFTSFSCNHMPPSGEFGGISTRNQGGAPRGTGAFFLKTGNFLRKSQKKAKILRKSENISENLKIFQKI